MEAEVALKLVRRSDQAVVASNALLADTFWTRLKGLIGKKSLADGEGLLFPKCNDIHMWMMSISIDVLFLKKTDEQSWVILKPVAQLKPWKVLPVACFKADDTLELPVGIIERLNLKAGEVLCIA